MEPKYQKGTYVEFAKDSNKGTVKPVVFPYPLKVIDIKPSKPNGFIYRLENNHDYYEEELQPVRPTIIKTTVLEREIQNNLIKNTQEEWKTELEGLQERLHYAKIDTAIVTDVQTFIDRSVPGDEYNDNTDDAMICFDLINENGDLFGTMWENHGTDYTCVIEALT